MANPIVNHEPSQPLLAASRLTGADIHFLQLVQLISSRLTGKESVCDPEARTRVEGLEDQFRSVYASIFERHLGEQALSSLAALQSAPVQRFLAARQMIAPALRQRLAVLEQRMGDLEI
ncbi:MAG: hypothetical protein ABI895_11510 [Deltaproteobacteria bacterium]